MQVNTKLFMQIYLHMYITCRRVALVWLIGLLFVDASKLIWLADCAWLYFHMIFLFRIYFSVNARAVV